MGIKLTAAKRLVKDWMMWFAMLWVFSLIWSFIKSFSYPEYWNFWLLYALLSTLVYGIVYYIYFIKEILIKKVKVLDENIGNLIVAILVLILAPIIMGTTVFIEYIGGDRWRFGIKGFEFLTVAFVSYFTIADLLIILLLKKKKIDNTAFKNTVRYVDFPTLFAVAVITLFQNIKIGGFSIDIFSAGANTFQLLCFNMLFTIFLSIDILERADLKGRKNKGGAVCQS
jgi:hypothetical protein